MSKIEAYKYKKRKLAYFNHIWDKETGKFHKLTHDNFGVTTMHQVLDSVTLAVEGGFLDDEKWVKQVFGKRAVFENFLFGLRQYDMCSRIHDRWWHSLAMLQGGVGDEEGLVTNEQIAASLEEHAVSTKQV